MTSTISVRPFRWDSLHDWTDLYNAAFGIVDTEGQFDEQSMREHLSQPGLDPEEDCLVARDGKDDVGVVIIWPELPIRRAVIEMGAIEGRRKPDVERALVEAAIERTHQLPVSVLHAQILSNDDAREKVFRGAGFQPVRKYAKMRWRRNGLPTLEMPNGFGLRSFRVGQDAERLTDIQNAAFADSWGFSPNTVEQIEVRVASKSTTPEGILFVTAGDEIVAYNWTVRSAGAGGELGRIAMTGVHPDYRGRGLSRPAVLAGMQWMVSQGVQSIELEMDLANVRAGKVYESLGFGTVANTVWYELGLDR